MSKRPEGFQLRVTCYQLPIFEPIAVSVRDRLEAVLQRQLHLEEVSGERLRLRVRAVRDQARVEVERRVGRVERTGRAATQRECLLLRERRAQGRTALLAPLRVARHATEEVSEVENVQLRRK